jgi:hypothetical protein
LKVLALPSEAREIHITNNLPEFLGKSRPIETQGFSDHLPKLSTTNLQERRVARLYSVTYAKTGTIARLALWGMSRKNAIVASEVRRLGGVVTIAAGRDPVTSEPFFHVDHASNDGNVAFRSRRIPDEDRAIQAAQILAEFTGATVKL